jgi:sulfide:quinone oxidoreductase
VPPHAAPAPVVQAGLTDETGWIPVNPRTMETNHEGVYAVGDVTSISTPNGYVPFLPKAGVFAHGQAEVVAINIAANIKGRGKMKEWDGQGSCFLEVGGGQSAFVKGNFFAEPKPEIEFHMPGRVWHAQKVIFEKYWMRHWF